MVRAYLLRLVTHADDLSGREYLAGWALAVAVFQRVLDSAGYRSFEPLDDDHVSTVYIDGNCRLDGRLVEHRECFGSQFWNRSAVGLSPLLDEHLDLLGLLGVVQQRVGDIQNRLRTSHERLPLR
jgi:hypothetical protein